MQVSTPDHDLNAWGLVNPMRQKPYLPIVTQVQQVWYCTVAILLLYGCC